MAVERRNPLPVGRYWVDVPEGDLSAFRQWLGERTIQIHVEQTTEREGSLGSPNTYWYLFMVKEPVPWFGPGFPTIAGTDIKSIDDTAQKPDPEIRLTDKLATGVGNWIRGLSVGDMASWAIAAGGLGIVGLAVYSYTKGKRRGRARRYA